MDLIQKLQRFSCIVSFDIDDKETDKDKEMYTLIDNIRISVLKSLMLKIESGRFVFDFIRSIPIVRLHSEKHDFSIGISDDSISISTPILSSRSSDEEETAVGKEIVNIIPHIERSLTAITSAITAKEEKPLNISKFSLKLYFKVNEAILEELLTDIIQVSFETDYNLDIYNLGLIASKEDNGQKYKIEIVKDRIGFELECKCEETFNIMDIFSEVIKDAEIFLKERKLHVKS